jgi:hypothetical protein
MQAEILFGCVIFTELTVISVLGVYVDCQNGSDCLVSSDTPLRL